jgi:hypothetical protein
MFKSTEGLLLAWVERYIKDYIEERRQLLRSRWLTPPSWFNRSKESTKYEEIELLLNIENEFNLKWVKHIRHAVVKYRVKPEDIDNAKLLIDTHISKHQERDLTLIIMGVIFAVSLRSIGGDYMLGIFSVIAAVFIGYERQFGSATKNSLEEFKAILELATKPKT